MFSPFEIRIGKVEGESWEGTVEFGRKVMFLHPRICAEGRMWEVGEGSSIRAKRGISDFWDLSTKCGRKKAKIRRKILRQS